MSETNRRKRQNFVTQKCDFNFEYYVRLVTVFLKHTLELKKKF